MRVYLGTDAAGLGALRAGALDTAAVLAESEDEEHEYEALLAAAEDGPVVVVAEIDHEDQPVTLAEVVALYTDIDGSGELGWFATQEFDTVLSHLG